MKIRYYKGLLLFLIGAGIFLRLYRISETLNFQADQARDAIVAKRMIKNGDLTLLGPTTSVGNMYLGPFYYYFMAPFLALTYPHPVGPAIGVALVNIATLILVSKFSLELFGKKASLVSTTLYAFWSLAIEFSRYSWNPNISPFFALLILYGLYKIHLSGSIKWLFLTLVSAGILAQLHYVALLMFPIIAVSLLWTMYRRKNLKFNLAVIGLAAGAVGMVVVPLIVFDLTHNSIISRSFGKFATSEEEFLLPISKMLTIVASLEGRMFLILSQLITMTKHVVWDRVISYSVLVIAAYFFYKERKSKKRYGVALVYATLITCIAGLSLLTTSVFDHYVLFVTPIITLFYGYWLSKLWNTHFLGKVLAAAFLVFVLYMNLTQLPTFRPAPGSSYDYYKRVANEIYPLAIKHYNIASISPSRDFLALGFRYVLETGDRPPAHHDDIFGLERLIIVDEVGEPNPLSHPAAIIAHPAAYLGGVIYQEKLNNGPTIYVLE